MQFMYILDKLEKGEEEVLLEARSALEDYISYMQKQEDASIRAITTGISNLINVKNISEIGMVINQLEVFSYGLEPLHPFDLGKSANPYKKTRKVIREIKEIPSKLLSVFEKINREIDYQTEETIKRIPDDQRDLALKELSESEKQLLEISNEEKKIKKRIGILEKISDKYRSKFPEYIAGPKHPFPIIPSRLSEQRRLKVEKAIKKHYQELDLWEKRMIWRCLEYYDIKPNPGFVSRVRRLTQKPVESLGIEEIYDFLKNNDEPIVNFMQEIGIRKEKLSKEVIKEKFSKREIMLNDRQVELLNILAKIKLESQEN